MLIVVSNEVITSFYKILVDTVPSILVSNIVGVQNTYILMVTITRKFLIMYLIHYCSTLTNVTRDTTQLEQEIYSKWDQELCLSKYPFFL